MNEIVYNSGTNIWNQSYLATLCVFYDKVWLPATTTPEHGGYLRYSRPKDTNDTYKLKATSLSRQQVMVNGEWRDLSEFFNKWEISNKLLFTEGVIERLLPPNEKRTIIASWEEFSSLGELIIDIPNRIVGLGSLSSWEEEEDFIIIWKDRAEHLLRKDITIPSIFITSQQRQYEYLKTLLASSTFKYFIPKIASLPCEEIIKVRNEVKDNREGFSMHLQTLSAEVVSRMAEGDSVDDISKYAEDIVYHKLVPLYREFARQLGAQKAGFWGSVLDKANKALEIESAPTTPKFRV